MTQKAIFEIAALADAVNKANRIAPNKGAAFDRAQGIVFDIDPLRFGEECLIMSTDLDVTFRAKVNFMEVGDTKCLWRISSSLVNGFMSTLVVGSGASVTLQEFAKDPSCLYFVSGKTKAKLRFISGDFPTIDAYDPDQLATVPNFAKRLAQVVWACDAKGSSGPLAGVHLDGQRLIACDRQALAMVPCVVPVDRPVTVPLSDVSALIKNTAEVAMRADTFHLQIMPDAWTQATCVLIGDQYPNVVPLLKESYTKSFEISNEVWKNALERTMVMSKSERYPVTTLEIGDGTLKIEIDAGEAGRIVDEIDIKGGQVSETEPFRVIFTPTILQSALAASGRPTIMVDYGPTPFSMVRLRDDNEFQCIIMPRQK